MKYITPDKMSDIELVATILGRNATDKECFELANCLVGEGTIDDGSLLLISQEHGPAAVRRFTRLQAAVELGRRSMAARAARKVTTISTPEDVVALMEPLTLGLNREVFHCLCLNTKNQIRKVVEVSVGSLSASIVHPRELFSEAVKLSAASVVVSHNHPSGDPTPSGADIQLTRRLTKAGDILGIEVLDHVVTGKAGEFVSMRDQGLM